MKMAPGYSDTDAVASNTDTIESPLGRFRVLPHRTVAGEAELWLDESCWGRFENRAMALLAVRIGQIGLRDWDSLRPACVINALD